MSRVAFCADHIRPLDALPVGAGFAPPLSPHDGAGLPARRAVSSAALLYASGGWPVIPLHSITADGLCSCGSSTCASPGKHPRTVHGLKDATTDPTVISTWWTRWPEANVGLTTGAESGIVALDVDPTHGGEASLAALEGEHGPLPPTIESRTGGGGRHIVFAHPGIPVRNSAGAIGSGLDMRGDSGYIVAPPSLHASGRRYEWAEDHAPGETALAPAPDWLLARMMPRAGEGREAGNGDGAGASGGEKIREGTRNATLLSLAGTMRRRGMSEPAILAALRAENAARCEPSLSDSEVAAIAGSAARYRRGGKKKSTEAAEDCRRTEPCATSTGRPTIIVRDELVEVVDEAERALVGNPTAGLYVCSRLLVRVVRDGARKIPGLTRPPGSPVIEPVLLPALRELVDRSAEWCKISKKRGDIEPALPPRWVSETLANRPDWPFPYLTGLIEAPTIRPDGSILSTPGYDRETGLLYEPSCEFPAVPERPTRDDAAAAAATLLDPFQNFPFMKESDRAAVMTAILTVIARHTIDGCTPLFAVGARAPGSGKGLLVDGIVIIPTGRAPARMSQLSEDNEMRKRIFAVGLSGAPVVLLDNIEGALGSPSMAMALTAREMTDRVIGLPKKATVELRAVWFATGNGLSYRGDFGRRVVPIDLDPRCEHPEDRSGFAYPELRAHVKAERPRLVAAALTILRAFHVAGRPRHGGARIGSYEEWDDAIRSAVIWVGLGDPAEGRLRIREEADADLDSLRAALAALACEFGLEAFTISDAVKRAEAKPELAIALLGLASTRGGDKVDPRRLGNAIRRLKGRIADGRQFERGRPAGGGVTYWRVVEAEGTQGGSSGTCGSVSPYAQAIGEDVGGERVELTNKSTKTHTAGDPDDVGEI